MCRVLGFLGHRANGASFPSAQARARVRAINDDVDDDVDDDDDDAVSKPDRFIARNDDDASEHARRKKK